jgi:MYXO-CTERM domain-containing protein
MTARRTLVRLASIGAFGALTWATMAPARAFTISTVLTNGCHERITSDALRAVRADLAAAAPIPAERNDRALIEDLQFAPPADMRDLGGAMLLVGVRDVDLEGHDAQDVSQLALVHGDPNAQANHCLRGRHERGQEGAEAALAACRAFITDHVAAALDGLDAAGAPDRNARTSLRVYLALRHGVDAPLPTFYVRMGQALHAVEDGFAHVYRTGDLLGATSPLDWVDVVDGDYDEAMDGPPHAKELDRCDDPDDLRRRRRETATEAAAALLRVTLAPDRTRDQKMADVQALLDHYFSYAPGCTFDNAWCAAPERAFGNDAKGCSVAGGPPRAFGLAALMLVVAGALRRRRRAIVVAALWFGLAAPARADEPVAATAPFVPRADDPSRTAVGAYVGGGGSINNEALAAAVGARLHLTSHWTLGLDAEWNPWIAVNGDHTVRAGAFNAYGTFILRLPLYWEAFNLRATANLGISRLLIDLYGAPSGTTGIFVGLAPLGIEWKMSRRTYLVLNPLGVAVPVPQLHGLPYGYPQYRAAVGFEVYAD